MGLASLTHPAKRSQRVIEGKPKAKLSFVHSLYYSVTSVLRWKLSSECDERDALNNGAGYFG